METPHWSTRWRPALENHIAHSGVVHWQHHLEPHTETLHWSPTLEEDPRRVVHCVLHSGLYYGLDHGTEDALRHWGTEVSLY